MEEAKFANTEVSKNLKLARQAKNEDNTEDAKLFYGKVREEDPENGEAKFYYAYYALQEGTNGELPKRFENLCAVLSTSIRLIKESALNKQEQLEIIEDIVNTFAPEACAEIKYMRHKNIDTKIGDSYVTVFEFSAINSVYLMGCDALEELGNQIGSLYENDSECRRIACIVWEEYIALLKYWYDYQKLGADIKSLLKAYKELGDKLCHYPAYKKVAIDAWAAFVELAQKFYRCVEKGEAEKYAEKIKKLDPSYVMPKKSGCISKA